MSKPISLISAQVKAIIFDLDDTLYDCSGTLVLKSKKLAAKIISKAIKCSEAEALKLQLELEARLGPKADISQEIADLYNLSEEFCKEIANTINTLEVDGAMLFSDAMDSINELKRIGYKLFLVTFGNREMQEKKIKTLGLERSFDEIVITENPRGKEKCFKAILTKYDLEPEQVLCVGDKIKDEIEVGKRLGMSTALMKHGRHYNFYKSEINDGGPYAHITKVSDLLGIEEN
ncbi:MAG: HAD family hydrolase [Candidatus Scalindua sp.]|jgi:putative hydrolase of the HAD superfamily|nr:HAD family hydrolase [Candidatus Scalindua sp.]MBT5304255.1 HAD family hydrolase [Candidatus Scalindua sp.]MBT6049052.1 HAD family hydrolase [Candidatus Scalindua sp.]MBT6230253.1 HAD family hydrolase [Candidatus Scalindua sp.]MBT6564715.1 HAD family hydrolase [Candidatus Scalindua sp.]